MRRAGLVLLVLVAVSAAACRGSSEDATGTPAALPASASLQSIVTSDGVRLSAHLFEADSDGRIAILSHQYGADQSSWYDGAERLVAMGIAALTFDFRGFGASGGEEDPDTLATDVEAALTYARGLGYDRVLLVGASMGGTASIVAAGEDGTPEGIDGVIALSAPIEFGALHAEDAAASMDVPVLLVAGEGDTSAIDSLKEFGETAQVPEDDQLVVASAAHGTDLLDSSRSQTIWDAITRFVESIWPDVASEAANQANSASISLG